MMTGQIHFTVPKEHVKKITEILEEKTKQHRASAWAVQAMLEKHQRETQSKIPDFEEKPETELDDFPRMWESINKENLEKLSPKDLGRLYKSMHDNMATMKRFIVSQSAKQGMIPYRDDSP